MLILPPSFPYGGMENPCLTFVTPTLLVGEGVSIVLNVFFGQMLGCSGFIKGGAPHKLTGCEDNFPHLHLEERFSYILSSVQIVLPTCENQCPPAESV